MSARFLNYVTGEGYASLWNKYRPVILKLMVDSAEEPQQYKLYKHEFVTLNAKDKTYDFTMSVLNGKANTNIKGSNAAKDLLNMLNLSPKAKDLMNEATYLFSVDKKFMLHVSRENSPEDTETVEAENSIAEEKS